MYVTSYNNIIFILQYWDALKWVYSFNSTTRLFSQPSTANIIYFITKYGQPQYYRAVRFARESSLSTMLLAGGRVDERDERIRDVYHMLTTYYNRIVPTDVKYNL